MNRPILTSMAAALAITCLTTEVHAGTSGVIYDSGPIDGFGNGWMIVHGWEGINNWTVFFGGLPFPPAVVVKVTIGAWTDHGATVSQIDWNVVTAGGILIGSGTAPVTDSFLFQNSQGYDISQDTFSVGNIPIGSGAYSLSLTNAVTSDGGVALWDQNDGTSSGYNGPVGTVPIPVPGESFQILGTVVPEPTAWALMLVGFGGVGAVVRSRRRTLVEAR